MKNNDSIAFIVNECFDVVRSVKEFSDENIVDFGVLYKPCGSKRVISYSMWRDKTKRANYAKLKDFLLNQSLKYMNWILKMELLIPPSFYFTIKIPKKSRTSPSKRTERLIINFDNDHISGLIKCEYCAQWTAYTNINYLNILDHDCPSKHMDNHAKILVHKLVDKLMGQSSLIDAAISASNNDLNIKTATVIERVDLSLHVRNDVNNTTSVINIKIDPR